MKWTLLSIALGLLAWAGFAWAAATVEPGSPGTAPLEPPAPPLVEEPEAPSTPPAVEAVTADQARSREHARGPVEFAAFPASTGDREGELELDHRLFSRAMPVQGRRPPPEVVP